MLAAVPTMLRSMLADGRIAAPALRTILTGGETLGAALGGSLRAALPQAGIYDLYGLTETGSCDFCLPPAEQLDGAGSIGRPTEQVAFRLIGEDGRPVPDGAQGELAIRTPFGMLGYLDDPALTAGSFTDGYFRTGDLARLRADGRVEIVGRLKDIISRGGNKIAPAEIDALLCSHPDVAAALCAGVPDARLGEAIHAVVVPRANAALTPEALRRWAAERIERYKVPDAIYLRDALPLGSTGKVARAGVAEMARAVAQGRTAGALTVELKPRPPRGHRHAARPPAGAADHPRRRPSRRRQGRGRRRPAGLCGAAVAGLRRQRLRPGGYRIPTLPDWS